MLLDHSETKTFLESIGYPITVRNGYWSTKAIYRDGKDETSVAIYPDNNLVIDFVVGEKFSIESLIAKTLHLPNDEEARKVLKDKNIVLRPFVEEYEPLIKTPPTFPKTILNNLLPVHDYILGRGISLETAQLFKGGTVLNKGKLKNRYVFIIYDSKMDIVGFTGRALDNNNPRKYLHFGYKSNWCWPCFLNLKDIRAKNEIILTESPMDIISLYESGVKNCACLFGTSLGLGLLNLLIKLNLGKIIISTNLDEHNVGQDAAEKLKKKLLKYFDSRSVKIKLPELKDFNEMLCKNGKTSIQKWYESK